VGYDFRHSDILRVLSLNMMRLLLTKDAADFFMISCEDATCFCAAALIEDALTIQGFSPFFTSTFTYVIEDILLRISRIFPEIIPESG
jgi:hypothetical protein